ncbi:MAG: hypothetical protein Q9167_003528 [Letrouitia subvulpina]
MNKRGVALRGLTTFLRAIEFLGAILILGITSYFLGVLTHRDQFIPRWTKAVEGMSGGAVIYSGFAIILTCFLGGLTFFAFLAVILDACFVACFIAIAILMRGGTRSCSGNPPSVLGRGDRTACRLESAAFAVAVALAILFLISLGLQILLSRNHKREKRFGPGPSNNYTSGSGRTSFWKRNKAAKTTSDAEMGAYGSGGTGTNYSDSNPVKNNRQPFWKSIGRFQRGSATGAGAAAAGETQNHNNRSNDVRPSHDTGVTGTTANSPTGTYGGANTKYGTEPTIPNVGQPTYQPYRQSAAVNHSQPYAEHDPSPYAEVHHGGYPHTSPESQQQYSTFGSGNYQR